MCSSMLLLLVMFVHWRQPQNATRGSFLSFGSLAIQHVDRLHRVCGRHTSGCMQRWVAPPQQSGHTNCRRCAQTTTPPPGSKLGCWCSCLVTSCHHSLLLVLPCVQTPQSSTCCKDAIRGSLPAPRPACSLSQPQRACQAGIRTTSSHTQTMQPHGVSCLC